MRQEADLGAALEDAVRLFEQLASAMLSFRAIVMVSASTRGDARPQRQTILSIASRVDIPEIAGSPEVASVREVPCGGFLWIFRARPAVELSHEPNFQRTSLSANDTAPRQSPEPSCSG
jgi:hypothetical protein